MFLRRHNKSHGRKKLKNKTIYGLRTALVLVGGLLLSAPVLAQQQSSDSSGSSVSNGPEKGGGHSGPGNISDSDNGSTVKPPPTAPKGCGPLGISCNQDGGKGSNTDPSSPHMPPSNPDPEPTPWDPQQQPKPPKPKPQPQQPQPQDEPDGPVDKPCKNCDPNL